MYRLIIDNREPLNAIYCEALTAVFGRCQVIPLTENYYVVEGFKMDISQEYFNKLLLFIEQYANKALLSAKDGGMDTQIRWLANFLQRGLICEFEPPEILLWSKVKIDEQFWCILPWVKPIADDFDN